MKTLVALLLLGQVVVFKDGAPVARETKRINFKGQAISCAPSFMGVDCTIDAGVAGSGSSWDGGPNIPTCSAGQVVFADGGQFSCVTDANTAYDGGVTGQAPGGSSAVNVTDPGTTLVSKAVTVAAGDFIHQQAWISINNNTGGNQTYTLRCRIGSTTVLALTASAACTTSATQRCHFVAACEYGVASSSDLRATATLRQVTTAAAGSSQTAVVRSTYDTSASDYTGAQTFDLNISGSTTTATQTAYVHGWRFEHLRTP